ncbi:hypothetical protein AVEN_133014-1 [Araneus ventricosus]|uniref:F-box domain-containing protein n=1 Tax=Araneus ventricosus TaxID=182803 RepID=A0A4Y2CUN3_ARAVE|nr:hypothetical protein AVEN_133014-1 [Araneus ventricosus]
MPLASLYRICLHRIYSFLKEEMWKLCIPNPFSELPTQAVDNLMKLILSHEEHPKIGDVILLLTSGRLTRLELCAFVPDEEEDLIVRAIDTRSSTSFENLSSHSKKLLMIYLVRNILSWNPYAEELHLDIDPGLDVIRNYQNLRVLRLYNGSWKVCGDKIFSVDLSVLSSLRNLEVLQVPFMDTDVMTSVLLICPKLISIGLNDSLDSLEVIAQRLMKNSLVNIEGGNQFQLRRCVWGKDFWFIDLHERNEYKSKFCDKMRFAVTLCPLVQELIFHVHVKEAIKALRFLKQLNLLRIDFYKCGDDFVQDFFELLREIGPQLKHFSLRCSCRVPVDIILDSCPLLQSLEIEFPPFVNNSLDASRDFPLKRLQFSPHENDADDKECLLFLLCNCKQLEELFLYECWLLDDALLRHIFERNCFPQLKVSCISDCSLTSEGYQMFIQKAASIETVDIYADISNQYFYDANSLFKEPNLRYPEDFNVREKEFFECRLNKNRF